MVNKTFTNIKHLNNILEIASKINYDFRRDKIHEVIHNKIINGVRITI